MDYCKRMTFGDGFFLAPLAVVSLRQIKYIAECAFAKVEKNLSGFEFNAKSNPRQLIENSKFAKYRIR